MFLLLGLSTLSIFLAVVKSHKLNYRYISRESPGPCTPFRRRSSENSEIFSFALLFAPFAYGMQDLRRSTSNNGLAYTSSQAWIRK